MRRLIISTIALLILFGITIENQIDAQHRRGRTRMRTQAVSNVTSTIEEIDRGTPQERATENPLENINTLKKVLFVMKNGVRIK